MKKSTKTVKTPARANAKKTVKASGKTKSTAPAKTASAKSTKPVDKKVADAAKTAEQTKGKNLLTMNTAVEKEATKVETAIPASNQVKDESAPVKKPAKVKEETDTLAIRCPIELHERIKAAAKETGVSLRTWLIDACQRKLA